MKRARRPRRALLSFVFARASKISNENPARERSAAHHLLFLVVTHRSVRARHRAGGKSSGPIHVRPWSRWSRAGALGEGEQESVRSFPVHVSLSSSASSDGSTAIASSSSNSDRRTRVASASSRGDLTARRSANSRRSFRAPSSKDSNKVLNNRSSPTHNFRSVSRLGEKDPCSSLRIVSADSPLRPASTS
jgi:hypothetical protein